MDFNLSAAQLELRKKLRESFTKEIAPRAAAVDDAEAIPAETIALLAGLGVTSLPAPQPHGAGEGFVTLAMAAEELAAACPSTALSVMSHWLCVEAVAAYGSDAQKSKALPALAKGDPLGAAALEGVTVTKSDNGFVLNGVSSFVTNGPTAAALLVAAQDADSGARLFLLDKSSGQRAGERIRTMGMRGASVCEIAFDNLAVPADCELAVGAGSAALASILDSARIILAAISTGIGQSACAVAKTRAETHVSGGKPIGAHQEVAFRYADIYIETDTARQLTYYAAWVKDEKQPAASPAAVAKLYASEAAVRSAGRALQIFGGFGYTHAAPTDRIYRDARFTEIGYGPSEIQRMLIADEALKGA